MTKRLVWIVFLIPLSIIIMSFAVGNRTIVDMQLAPFSLINPQLIISAPLFVFLFISLVLGLIIGSSITWVNQGIYRRKARFITREVETLKAEIRKNDANVRDAMPALPSE
jgi:uncharacterized integral membrane protein